MGKVNGGCYGCILPTDKIQIRCQTLESDLLHHGQPFQQLRTVDQGDSLRTFQPAPVLFSACSQSHLKLNHKQGGGEHFCITESDRKNQVIISRVK